MQLKNYLIYQDMFLQYKTQHWRHKVILENVGKLKFVLYCYKNQGMCNKSVENYPHALEFVPEC